MRIHTLRRQLSLPHDERDPEADEARCFATSVLGTQAFSTGALPGGRAEFCGMRAAGAVWSLGAHFLHVCCCSQASQCLSLFGGPSLRHPWEVLRGLIRCRARRPWSRLLSELARCDGHRAVPEGCASFAETLAPSSFVVTLLSLLWVAAFDIAAAFAAALERGSTSRPPESRGRFLHRMDSPVLFSAAT